MFSVAWIGKRETPEERARRQAKLLVEATREFSANQRPSAAEINAYKELFYQLIVSCDAASRRIISASIANCPSVPASIIIFLASDANDVAVPVLMFSPVIGEAQIVRLAGRLPREHLRVLCRRSDLTEASVKALLDNGGGETLGVLRANPANRKFKLLHGDLPARDATKPPEAQAVSAAEGDNRNLGEKLVRLAEIGGRTGARPQAASISGTLSFSRKLLLAARAGEQSTIASLIATQAGSDAALTESLLISNDIEPGIVFLKGLGVDAVTAMQVLLLMRPQIGSDRKEFARISRLYRNVDAAECGRLLKSLAVVADGTTDPQAGWTFAQAARSRRSAIAGASAGPVRAPAARQGSEAPTRGEAMVSRS